MGVRENGARRRRQAPASQAKSDTGRQKTGNTWLPGEDGNVVR